MVSEDFPATAKSVVVPSSGLRILILLMIGRIVGGRLGGQGLIEKGLKF